MRNLAYLGYFLLNTDYSDLNKSINCTAGKGYSKVNLIFDMVYCSLKFGSSFVDYFNFQFYRKSSDERKAYATMGVMYRFHKKVNDRNFISKVDDKSSFFTNYSEWCFKPSIFLLNEFNAFNDFINTKINSRIVIKNPGSTGGKGVQIAYVYEKLNKVFVNDEELFVFFTNHFKVQSVLYIEDYIEQHELLNKISPSGVNTIRVITMINHDGKPDILGAVLRISVDCPIDNYSAGNLAADICIETGVVLTGGIRKRSSCDCYHEVHPLTKEKILGFEIPFWEKTLKIIKDAALVVPEVRTIGWDIAITPTGPKLIEGNSTWNKDTWQIPAGIGKIHLIKKYL